MLKLYYHPLSTYSRRVRIALLEKRIPAELIEVDLFARAQFQADYLTRNPYGRVPTLEEDGLTLFESSAILEYLEARYPEPALLPSDRIGCALTAMHLKLCDLELAANAHKILLPKRFMPREKWKLDVMEKAKARIERHFSILEKQLEGRSYLIGNRFGLVEIAAIPFLEFLPLMEVSSPPAVTAWAQRLLGRPSARETRPER
ncbi:MAG: glutathione S-transferase family protein [Acidobacteriota bacterium]